MCGVSALHKAALYANTTKLRKLLVAGADVNDRDKMQGCTPLYFACMSGDVKTVGILIAFGADISMVGDDKRTCLHLATHTAKPGSLNLVKFLLEHGATNIINAGEIREKTALHIASGEGREDIARILLDRGADPKAIDKEGFRPFHDGATQGQCGVMQLLLERGGAEVDSSNAAGTSTGGHAAAVRMLIDVGADVNKFSTEQMFPLYGASQEGCVEVVKELIAAGAQLDKVNPRGRSCLHIASGQGRVQVVLELLSAGADVRKYDEEGASCLHLAAQDGRSDVVRELLRAGAVANHADDEGVTSLMLGKDVVCLRLLLDAGAMPNATDAGGYNALHYGGLLARPASVICCLFKAGCDPTALDNNDETPADVARKEGNMDAAALLERLAADVRLKNPQSSNPDSTSMAMQEGKTEETGVQKEPEVGVSESIEKDDAVRTHKIVKPCAHCGIITHRKCAGCRVNHYCSRDCQRATYSEHKEECAALCEQKKEAKAQRAAARANLLANRGSGEG